MPFVELPERTRAGSTKYAEDLKKCIKNPGKWWTDNEEKEQAGAVATSLRKNKYALDLAEDNNGSFEFKSLAGLLYMRFVKGSKTTKKGKK